MQAIHPTIEVEHSVQVLAVATVPVEHTQDPPLRRYPPLHAVHTVVELQFAQPAIRTEQELQRATPVLT